MTEVPTCPGVAEYLYQAARPALVRSDGTCIVPSALVPRRSSFEVTPMAGMRTDTGTDLRSEGPRPRSPPGRSRRPAAAHRPPRRRGHGEWPWRSAAGHTRPAARTRPRETPRCAAIPRRALAPVLSLVRLPVSSPGTPPSIPAAVPAAGTAEVRGPPGGYLIRVRTV